METPWKQLLNQLSNLYVTSASAGERHQHTNAVETGQNWVKKEKIKVLAKTKTQAEDHK